MHKYSRAECAGLEGNAWLKWLTQKDETNFNWEQYGQILTTAVYAPLGKEKILIPELINWHGGPSTAIGDAIGIAIAELRRRTSESKVFILLTDGTDNSSNLPPLEAAQIAEKYGIRIYTIGVGSDNTMSHSMGNTNLDQGVNEVMLQKIADITGGKYFRAKDDYSLEKIYNKINDLEKIDLTITEYRSKSLHKYPLLVACFLFLVLCLMPLYRRFYPINPQIERLEGFIDKHLIPHLLKNSETSQLSVGKSIIFGSVLWLFLLTALASPRWNFKEMQSFAQDKTLLILLDLSKSMDSDDIKPSRLSRARQEIEDLLNLNTDIKIGLLAFAADAHIISPITDDMNNIRHLLPLIGTDLVYVQGTRLSSALKTAKEMLSSEAGANKSILIITDGGFQDNDLNPIITELVDNRVVIHTLGTATQVGAMFVDQNGYIKRNGEILISKLEKTKLQELSKLGGGKYFDTDYTDNNSLEILNQINLRSSLMEKDLSFHDNKKWEERFYIFVFPVILVAGARNLSINDRLFLNKDQLAQKALEEIEDFDTAIKLFDDPYKKGVAYYKSGNFQDVAKYFRQNQRPEMQTNALYNLGNALTKQNKLDEEINTYQQVLEQNPDHEKAKHNMKIAKLMLSSKNNNDFPNGGGGGGGDDGDDKEEENDSDGMDDKNNKADKDKNEEEDDGNETEKNNTDKQDDKSHTSPDTKNNDTASGDKSEKPYQNSSTEGNEQEGKDSSDSTQEIDVDQWLNKISNDHKNFLKNQFYIESQTQNNNNNQNLDPCSGNYSNIEIINGVSSVTNEWHFILKPKKLGNLIIPTFTIKTATSSISTKIITIKVTKTELLTATKSNNITAISKVSNDNPYLDQPIIYQIQLLTEADVRDVLFNELKLEGMLIKHLGAHKIYNRKYNKRSVTVIELSYLITPTKSGKLVIPPHAIRGFYVVNDDQKNTRVKSLFDSFFDNEPLVNNNNRLVKFELASKEITLNIEPAIKNLVPWLPAESLSLHRTFDNTIFEIGKPITTTIEIKSRGLAKNQLPQLGVDMLKGEGYKVYAENVETNEEMENLSITSSRKEVFTIVPQKAGKLTIPTMEIKWWDVTNKKMKIATIKAQTIDILWNGLKLDPQQAKTTQKQELSEKSNIDKESNHPSVKSTLIGKLINIFDNTKIYYLIISILIIILLASIFRFMTLSNPLKKEIAASGNAVIFAKINTNTDIKLTDTMSPTELYKFLQSYSNVHWQIPLNSSLEKMFALIQEKNPQIKNRTIII
ncbi:unnamed protein product [Rotaria magnacalcarata]|uniref:VWFA domain-containing protein n=1 Tax=Rotaria magnacalcarata TaxID=392030 RepID=A0A818Z7J3_9BILA|nr:unnamed protein product [Rotaria magnacalcarata]